MQINETLNEGLKRELKVVIPAAQLEERLKERVEGAKSKMRIRGFRPGKVPSSHVRRLYGKSFMAEIVNEIINESPNEMLTERGERPAMQPQISMTEDEQEAERVLNGEADFEFTVNYEVVPEFELKDVSGKEVTRPVVDIPEEEVNEQLERIAESARNYETKDGAAENGDRVTIDYVGKIDGEPFEGGADNGAQLKLGSNSFIPGFEEQLIGAKAGDQKTVEVTFPEEYGATHLAGKQAQFDVTVHEVSSAGELVLDDELAQKLGLENMESFRKIVRDQIEGQYAQMTRQKVKRQVLDLLDEQYQFESPERLVEAEYQSIWQQVTAELARTGHSFEDEDTTEEAASADYRRLAERRVRLGLVLSKIGEEAEVTVAEEELQRALIEQVRRYPGQEQQVYEYYQKNPNAIASLRAPIFEEKVIDHLLEQMDVKEETVSKEELAADADEDPMMPSSSASSSDETEESEADKA